MFAAKLCLTVRAAGSPLTLAHGGPDMATEGRPSRSPASTSTAVIVFRSAAAPPAPLGLVPSGDPRLTRGGLLTEPCTDGLSGSLAVLLLRHICRPWLQAAAHAQKEKRAAPLALFSGFCAFSCCNTLNSYASNSRLSTACFLIPGATYWWTSAPILLASQHQTPIWECDQLTKHCL